MAGGSSAATEPAPGESGREQETPHVENETSQRQTEGGAQQDNNDPPSPPLPPRPLPPAHHENLKGQRPLPPLPPLPKGVHFGPLPIEQPRVPSLDYGRREYPVWHKAKLGMMTLSLMVCAVIFGVGIAMGFHNVAWAWDVVPVDYEFGTSAAAVCSRTPSSSFGCCIKTDRDRPALRLWYRLSNYSRHVSLVGKRACIRAPTWPSTSSSGCWLSSLSS